MVWPVVFSGHGQCRETDYYSLAHRVNCLSRDALIKMYSIDLLIPRCLLQRHLVWDTTHNQNGLLVKTSCWHLFKNNASVVAWVRLCGLTSVWRSVCLRVCHECAPCVCGCVRVSVCYVVVFALYMCCYSWLRICMLVCVCVCERERMKKT